MIGIVNEARNNVARPKLDPIWKEIDVYSHQGQLPVYYDLDLQQQAKNDYNQKTAPFFSRAQFIFPPGQIDETGLQFVSDPAALDHLPPPQERLRALRPEAREYLILSPSDTAPEGELLYRGARFQLSRRSFDPAP